MLIQILVGVLGIGLVAYVAMGIYAIRHRPRTHWYMFTTQDEYGDRKTEKRAVPECDRFARDGISHVDGYVGRLAESRDECALLMITSAYRWPRLDLVAYPDCFIFRVHVPRWRRRRRERTLRDLLARRDAEPQTDRWEQRSAQPGVRVFAYGRKADAHDVADVCRLILRNVHGIGEHGGLDFILIEDPPPPSESPVGNVASTT